MKRIAKNLVALSLGIFWVHPFVLIFLLAAAIYLHLLNDRSQLASKKWFWTPTILILVHVLSISPAAIALSEIESAVRLICVPLIIINAFLMSDFSTAEAQRLLSVIAAACIFSAVMMYFQTDAWQIDFSFSRLITRYRGDGYYIFGRNFPGAPVIGSPLGVGFITCLFGFLFSAGLKKLLFSIGMLITLIILLLSISRGAIISTFVASLVLIFGYSVGRINLKLVLSILSGLSVAAIIGVGVFLFALENIPTAVERYEVVTNSSSDDASLSERGELMKYYFKNNSSNFTGNGYSYHLEPNSFNGLTAHNEFLGTWVASGIGGFLSLLAIMFYWFWLSLKGVKSNDPEKKMIAVISSALLMFFMLTGMTEHYTISSSSLAYLMFWIFVSLFFSILAKPVRNTIRERNAD